MNKKIRYSVLALIFIISLGLRMYFVFQTPHFSLESYYIERQVESIIETGLPIYYDNLSFSGTSHAFMPLFYYIMAFFSLIIGFPLAGKIIPNLFASSIVFFTFILAKRITKHNAASLMTAFISAFVPIYFMRTLNNISPFSIVMPLILYLVYCFIEKKQIQFIIFSFLLTLIHFSAAIVPISLLVYIFISKIEHFRVKKENIEFTIFSIVLNLWLLFVFYKRAFLFHGLEIIYQNMPLSLIGQHFVRINLLQAIYLIGIIPFIYGVISVYHFLVKKRFYEGFLMISFIIAPAILLWTALIELNTGLIFLGIFMTVMFSSHYNNISNYLKKTKFSKLKYYKYYFLTSSLIIFILTSVVPSIVLSENEIDRSLKPEEYEAMIWMKNHTENNSVILALVEEGNAIASIAERKNVIDSNFILVNNINLRYREYKKMFSSPYIVETISLMNKYDVDYIYISGRNHIYSESKFSENCFVQEFKNEEVEILKTKCELRD